MAAIERLTITMPAEMAAQLRAVVKGGEYATTGEIIREALHDWIRACDSERRVLQKLRNAITNGDESGPGILAAYVFAELRQIIGKKLLGDEVA